MFRLCRFVRCCCPRSKLQKSTHALDPHSIVSRADWGPGQLKRSTINLPDEESDAKPSGKSCRFPDELNVASLKSSSIDHNMLPGPRIASICVDPVEHIQNASELVELGQCLPIRRIKSDSALHVRAKSLRSATSKNVKGDVADGLILGRVDKCARKSTRRSTAKCHPKTRSDKTLIHTMPRSSSADWITSLRQPQQVSRSGLKRSAISKDGIPSSKCVPTRKSIVSIGTVSWCHKPFAGRGMIGMVWRILCMRPKDMHVIIERDLVRRWLCAFYALPLTFPRKLALCYHGTTAEMVPLVMKAGFRLPKMHPCLYTSIKFHVADFYASSTKGGFHSACGAAFRDEKQQDGHNLESESMPGNVFLCLGLNPEVGPSYLRFMKAEHLLPCCIVNSCEEACAAEAHLRPLLPSLLTALRWGVYGAVLDCFRAWSRITGLSAT